MWQVLIAAAIAGSTSLVAKHFLNHQRSPKEEREQPQSPPPPQGSIEFGSGFGSSDAYECGREQDCDIEQKGGEAIFRFSSSGGSSGKKKTRIPRKKSGITGRRLRFVGENYEADTRSGGFEGNSKRFAVCLKKRKTAKTVPAKCGSRSSEDDSLFGWGLGVGIMCMMSAGKAEISKLSTAMDETSKVVQELKSELYKRKSAQMDADSNNLSSKNNQPLVYRTGTRDRYNKVSGNSMNDDVECPSSVLTEEPEPQLLEMDQLEAELATELQKLPWSDTDAFGHERLEANMAEGDVLCGGVDELEGLNTCQKNGVLPSELEQKLCHVLIEQQENQIEELGSELQQAQSKLNEKEAELQALKDCVRRLTEFSLSTVSDDEAEIQTEQGSCNKWDNLCKMGSESESRKSTVGMKRPISSA